MSTAQAPLVRVPLADGTPVSTPDLPPDDLIPISWTSDVMGTGWFAAAAANVKPGMTVAVVGDGAVGLLGVLSAKQMGAEKIIAMSRHEARQKLAREFGATDIVPERGDEAVSHIKDMTGGIGADAVLECVGTQESMMQAIRSRVPGGGVGYVGVPHDASLDLGALFWTHVRLHGGPAPVRQFLPDLIKSVWNRKINPGKAFDSHCPSIKLQKDIARWTSAARSKPCSVREAIHKSKWLVVAARNALERSAMDGGPVQVTSHHSRPGPIGPGHDNRDDEIVPV